MRRWFLTETAEVSQRWQRGVSSIRSGKVDNPACQDAMRCSHTLPHVPRLSWMSLTSVTKHSGLMMLQDVRHAVAASDLRCRSQSSHFSRDQGFGYRQQCGVGQWCRFFSHPELVCLVLLDFLPDFTPKGLLAS
ncbi:hypothetical protein NDU88_002336 [Pleurodeles waltl]|uniref:Uncharacterized protein n=1 Tax=Pleurodeles waltl TaxID=8319 RepID=A0AAV7NG55_PLEWA|nr:hypothetical protein NDU88_002336 [Pleurodeles waltl]